MARVRTFSFAEMSWDPTTRMARTRERSGRRPFRGVIGTWTRWEKNLERFTKQSPSSRRHSASCFRHLRLQQWHRARLKTVPMTIRAVRLERTLFERTLKSLTSSGGSLML